MDCNILNKSELIEFVNNYSSNDSDKKKRGVVFTNENTIMRLLNLLPSRIWKDKSLKWLDPGSGIGNIMIYVYLRLMDNINIKNEELRRKHILENMLYFVELKTEFVDYIKSFFCSDKYNLNIHNGSFVNMNTVVDNNNIYNDSILYDVIVTNPPYQKPDKSGKASSKPLYHLFIEKAINILKEGGYLVAIHPFTWRRKSREIKLIDTILKYQLIYIYTDNNFKEFGVSAIHINYYLLEKKESYKKTICENYFNNKYYKSTINIDNKLGYLPILLTEQTFSIIDKMTNINNNKLDIKLESKLSSTHSPENTHTEFTKIFKYKNYHTFSIRKQCNIYKYSKEKHPSHDKTKVIMNFRGGYNIFRPFIDNGDMGITDNALYMEIKSDDNIMKLFNSDVFRFILHITSYNYAPNKKIEFHILNTLSISEKYGLTKKEEQFIKGII